jgi:hypothetical protein
MGKVECRSEGETDYGLTKVEGRSENGIGGGTRIEE